MDIIEKKSSLSCPKLWGLGQTSIRSFFPQSKEPHRKSPILLLHGAGQNSLIWRQSALRFAQLGFCAFAFDYRYHGQTTIGEIDPCTEKGSDGTQMDMKIDTLVEDTHIVMTEILKLHPTLDKKMHLVGHSLGGAIAVRVFVYIKRVGSSKIFKR